MNSTVLESTIKRVTIYREGALVERTAILAIADGEAVTRVSIEDLPVCLDDGSVRISLRPRGEGNPAPIAQDFTVSLAVRERKSKDDSTESIRNEIRSLKRGLADVEFRIGQMDASIDRLSSVGMPERPRSEYASGPMPNPTNARLKLSAFLANRRAQLTEERQQLSIQQEELGERLAFLGLQLDAMNEEVEIDADELKKAIHLRLRTGDGQTAGESELTLTYLVPGARWYPSYSLYTADESDDALAMHAYVAQHTGEDWADVTLRLSTAKAQQWTELPELHSLRIGKQQPPPGKKGWRAAPVGVDLLFADYDSFKRGIPTVAKELTGAASVIRANVAETAGAGDDLDDESLLEDEELEMAEEEAEPDTPLSAPPDAPPEALQAPSGSAAGAFFHGAGSGGMRSSARAKKLQRAAPSVKEMADSGLNVGQEPRMETRPEARFLDYHGLRMPAPDESRRGKLQALATGEDGASSRLLRLVPAILSRAVDLSEPPVHCVRPSQHDGFDFAYECGTLIDIPSQRECTFIPVLRQKVEVARRYVTVPREGPEVFRMATVTNPLENPLLAGPLDIYLDGKFFVSGYLKVVAPRGKAEIGLGVEQGVKVARNVEFSETGEGGLLGGTVILRHRIRIELVNNLAHQIQIQVRERVPATVDGDDDARVEIALVEPQWEKFVGEAVGDRGGHAWNLTVPPGGRQELNAEYRIKISSKNELVGGNRREA